MQCDFDTIGTRSVVADIETALVIHELFVTLGFSEFTIHINNRQVLNGLLERLELRDRSTEILRALDKLAKIGPERVAQEMQKEAGASAEQAQDVLRLAALEGDSDQILADLDNLVEGSKVGAEGVANLRDVLAGTRAAGVPDQRIKLDVAIARGLDYYTGIVFETFLNQLPGIGSVCSGGRYDNLAGLFTKRELPGIGASLGLDRLLAAMEELEMIQKVRTPAQVFIPFFAKGSLHDYLRLAAKVRAAGLSVEVYPDPKKLGQQLKYADQRGFIIALIAGDDELARGVCQVKDLRTAQSQECSLASDAMELIDAVKSLLAE
jgi:histidyl-tRNA synthetase